MIYSNLGLSKCNTGTLHNKTDMQFTHLGWLQMFLGIYTNRSEVVQLSIALIHPGHLSLVRVGIRLQQPVSCFTATKPDNKRYKSHYTMKEDTWLWRLVTKVKGTLKMVYIHAPHNDFLVNNGPHIRQLSHNIRIPLCYNCVQYSVQ